MRDSLEHVFKMGVAAVAFSAVLGCLCSDGGRYDGATLAALLGIVNPPASWIGRPRHDAFR